MTLFTFKNKLLFAFIMFGIALVGVAGFVVYKMDEANIKALSMQKASRMFSEREDSFKYYIRDVVLKIRAVSNSEIFENYINGSGTKRDVDNLFVTIASTGENIMQLRFLDTDGKELVRVNRNSYGETPYILDNQNLQNKKNRYYFQAIMALESQEFWYSKIDLNINYKYLYG
jgi:hypothetical protein